MAKPTAFLGPFLKKLRRQLWSLYCAVTFAHVNKLLDKGKAQQIDCESAHEFRPANLHPRCLAAKFDAIYNPLKVSFLPSRSLSLARQRQLLIPLPGKGPEGSIERRLMGASSTRTTVNLLHLVLGSDRMYYPVRSSPRSTECQEGVLLDWAHLFCCVSSSSGSRITRRTMQSCPEDCYGEAY